MLANVLKSPAAVLASVEIVRAFVRLRGLVLEHRDLARRLDVLEQRYDLRFKAVFDAVRRASGRLTAGPASRRPLDARVARREHDPAPSRYAVALARGRCRPPPGSQVPEVEP